MRDNKIVVSPKKQLGQNFLVDANIIQRIISCADLSDQDEVLEIGPGTGSLTREILKHAHSLTAIELDHELSVRLAQQFKTISNFNLVNDDVLKVDMVDVLEKNFNNKQSIKLVANLPYYITNPILKLLIRTNLGLAHPFKKILIMIQKEVAQRLVAEVGNRSYGSLSILVQYYMRVKIEFTVPPSAFYPRPKVDSAVISLIPTENKHKHVLDISESHFFKFIQQCFNHRRKNILNNLHSIYTKSDKLVLTKVLDEVGINPSFRPERLTVDDFIKIANDLHQHKFI